MHVSLRLYKGIVHIPTSYRVEADGFYVAAAPLESVPVEHMEGLRQAIVEAIGRGNPTISRDEARALIHRKDSPTLRATGAKSWYALDQETTGLWNITDRTGSYQIRVDQPMQPRGWHEDKSKRVAFPPGTPIEDVIDRLIAMIQERARR